MATFNRSQLNSQSNKRRSRQHMRLEDENFSQHGKIHTVAYFRRCSRAFMQNSASYCFTEELPFLFQPVDKHYICRRRAFVAFFRNLEQTRNIAAPYRNIHTYVFVPRFCMLDGATYWNSFHSVWSFLLNLAETLPDQNKIARL